MIAVLDYGAGNLFSVCQALERLGAAPVATADLEKVRQAEKVIFPGVGQAATAMAQMQASGLDRLLPTLEQPVVGICLGMQLMCRHSEEGDVEGLGIFPETVRAFPKQENVPHMGWNDLVEMKGGLFAGLEPRSDFYFVHSYYATLGPSSVGSCEYIFPFSAALQRDNFYGVQFHPEKSGAVGAQLLKNFLEL